MKLNAATTISIDHREELPVHLSYLTGGKNTAYVSMTLRAGGHLNPDYMAAVEAIDLQSKVSRLQASSLSGGAAIKAQNEAQSKVGVKMLRAMYQHCVVEWDTNIQDSGEVMVCNEDNFMALSDCGIPEVTQWVVSAAKRVSDVAEFIAQADEETEKN